MTVLSETEISNKKLAAGLLGIFLGSFGIHKFVLGYNNAGIIMLVVSLAGGVVTCGIATGVMSVIGMIEGIIYLTKSTDEFREIYLDQQRLGSDGNAPCLAISDHLAARDRSWRQWNSLIHSCA